MASTVSPVVANWKAHLKRKAAIWDKLAQVTSSLHSSPSSSSSSSSAPLQQLLTALEQRSSEMDQLRALNADLSRKLQSQRADLGKADQKQVEAQKKLANRVAALERDLEKARAQRGEAKAAIDQLKEANSATVAEKNAQRAEMLAEIAQLKQSLAAAQVRGSKEELNRQLAEAAVGDTKAAQEAMQQRVAALRKQLSEEQKDREAITKAAEIAARQKDAAIHEAHELARQREEQLSAVQSQLAQTEQRHSAEKARLVQMVKQAVAKNHGKEEQLTKVQQGFGGTVAVLQAENDQLRQQLAGHQAEAQSRIDVVQMEAHEAGRKVEALTKTVEQLTKSEAAAARRARELNIELEKAAAAQTQQKSMLRAELASSEQQWFEESEDLKAAVAGQEQVIAKQRLELEQTREQQAALHAKNKAIGQQLVHLQQERTQFQFQLEEGSAQASTMEQQLREALRAGGEQVRQLQDSEQRLEEEGRTLQAKVLELETALAGAGQKLAQATDEVATLKKQQEAAQVQLKQRNDQLLEKARELQQAHAALQSKDTDTTEVVARVTKELKNAKQATARQVQQLQQQMNQQAEHLKALKLDNDAKTASARDLQKTVQTLEAALKKHEKSSKGSGKTLADLQTRLQTAERLRVEAESATKKGLVEGRRREKALQEEVDNKTAELEKLRKAVKSTQRNAAEQVGQFSDKLRALKREQQVLVSQYEAAQAEIKTLRGSSSEALANQEQAKRQLRTAAQNAEKESVRLQKLVKEQRAEKLVLEKRAADVAADKARLTEQCAQAMEAQQQLQASLRTVQERLATVAAAKAVADERLEEKTQECQRLHDSLAEAQEVAERSKKRLEAALERQRRQEREQEDGQGEEARAAAALRQQLQRKSVDLDEVAKERDATKARLAELEKASSASLHKMSEEFQKQEAQLAKQRAEVAALTKRAQQAELDLSRAQDIVRVAQNEKGAAVAAAQQKHEATLQELSALNLQVERFKEEARAAASELKDARASADESRIRCEGLQAQNTALQEEVASTQAGLSDQWQVIAQEKAELEARATRAEAEIRGFRAETEWERNEMQNKVAKLQKAVAQSAAKLERKNEKLEALKKKSEEKAAQFAARQRESNTTLLKLRQDLADAQAVQQRGSPHEVAGGRNADLRVKELERQLAAVRESAANQETSLRGIQQKMDAAQRVEQQLRHEVASLQQQVDAHSLSSSPGHENAGAAAQQIIAGLRKENAALKDRMSQMRARADLVRQEYEDQLDQMQASLESRQEGGSEWKNTVQSAMQKLDQLYNVGAGSQPGPGTSSGSSTPAALKANQAQAGHSGESSEPAAWASSPSSRPARQVGAGNGRKTKKKKKAGTKPLAAGTAKASPKSRSGRGPAVASDAGDGDEKQAPGSAAEQSIQVRGSDSVFEVEERASAGVF
eukprot:INCI14088.2.p1 GENE.INCI14088.2~~INCI14088.2.p1  ORF type:complete len:1422 (-),score=418.78 INCI14088.2:416-4681(-)